MSLGKWNCYSHEKELWVQFKGWSRFRTFVTMGMILIVILENLKLFGEIWGLVVFQDKLQIMMIAGPAQCRPVHTAQCRVPSATQCTVSLVHSFHRHRRHRHDDHHPNHHYLDDADDDDCDDAHPWGDDHGNLWNRGGSPLATRQHVPCYYSFPPCSWHPWGICTLCAYVFHVYLYFNCAVFGTCMRLDKNSTRRRLSQTSKLNMTQVCIIIQNLFADSVLCWLRSRWGEVRT